MRTWQSTPCHLTGDVAFAAYAEIAASPPQALYSNHPPIGPLRRFWALDEERIIPASALMAHLRKRTNAQRLVLSTCKTGALPLSYGPMLTCA